MQFYIYTRFDEQIGTLTNIAEAVHKDELNGEDSLTIVAIGDILKKGHRIVWRDDFGKWHEHIVNEISTKHENGMIVSTYYCENSIAELITSYIDDLRNQNIGTQQVLAKALANTRWEVGNVTVSKIASGNFYHCSAREAVQIILENWGGELETEIRVTGDKISARRINILQQRGNYTGKRFAWANDIESITRTVNSDDVVTALYGYGAGIEVYDNNGDATGGYTRRIDFSSITGSKCVYDTTALAKWGLPTASGALGHTYGVAVFEDCKDKNELLRLTKEELKKRSKPRVTYEASVLDLARGGFEFADVQTGDTVQLIDDELGERLEGRVLSVERHLLNEDTSVITLGNITRNLTNSLAELIGGVRDLTGRSSVWDAAGKISSDYINGIINNLNVEMNQTGGYTYLTPNEGITVFDKKQNENPTKAMQINSMGFRIANGKHLVNGKFEWSWRTFGTADGFVADRICAGTIRGGANTWNLETGELRFKRGAIYSDDGSNVWNLSTSYFRVTTGVIGGLNISSSSVYNDSFALRENGIHFNYSNYSVGKIGTNSYAHDETKRGLVFDLEDDAAYMCWACRDKNTDDTYTIKLAYINQAFGSYEQGTLAISCPIDGRWYPAKNMLLDPETSGGYGCITDTMRIGDYQLVFKRGLLVKSTHYT